MLIKAHNQYISYMLKRFLTYQTNIIFYSILKKKNWSLKLFFNHQIPNKCSIQPAVGCPPRLVRVLYPISFYQLAIQSATVRFGLLIHCEQNKLIRMCRSWRTERLHWSWSKARHGFQGFPDPRQYPFCIMAIPSMTSESPPEEDDGSIDDEPPNSADNGAPSSPSWILFSGEYKPSYAVQ